MPVGESRTRGHKHVGSGGNRILRLFNNNLADIQAGVHLYLQGFEDDHRRARGTGGVVVQELLQLILQAAEVGRGAEGLRAPVLNGAEGLWETGKLLEALRQQPVHRLG